MLTIDWKRLDRNGTTCARCGDTGRALRATLRELNRLCRPRGVGFRLKETRLSSRRVGASNAVFIEGRRLETFLPGVSARKTVCASCAALLGQPARCRALSRAGKVLQAIPATWIREAACRAAECHCPADAAIAPQPST